LATYENRPTFLLASSSTKSTSVNFSSTASAAPGKDYAVHVTPSSSSTQEFFAHTSQHSDMNFTLPHDTSRLQSKLRKKQKSQWEKVDYILGHISDEFQSLGDFLKVLFQPKYRGRPDERTMKHRMIVSAFLSGRSTVRIGEIINLIYNHGQSQPSASSKDFDVCNTPFSPCVSHLDMKYARPALSTWATQLVGDQVSRECHALTQNDPGYPDHLAQLRPSSKRKPGATPVT
jgi:hypothetical protein